jgi:hypothetical protein
MHVSPFVINFPKRILLEAELRYSVKLFRRARRDSFWYNIPNNVPTNHAKKPPKILLLSDANSFIQHVIYI